MIKRRDTRKSVRWALLPAVALFIALSACGGGSSNSAPPPPIAVAITPGSPSVAVGATQQFTAVVTGTSNTAVNWSVAESNGGIINASGNYMAPMKAGSFHVVATSQADSSKSAIAGVSVTAPAPVFGTTPPTASAEGTLYSYAVAATDPAGTAVTLSLTTAPAAAQLSGGTLTWTPTWNQSRIPNAFALTATTDAGGTATQSWSLAPDGTVYGHYFLHFWGGDSDTIIPERDFSRPPDGRNPGTILLWSPQSDGSLKTIQGVGFADGTFQYPNVPAGSYIFSLNGHPELVQGIWENTSSLYWDADENGYPPLDPSQWWPEALTINVTGLDPFVLATDEFDLYDRDGYWTFTSWLPDGQTTYAFATPYLLENAPSVTDRFVAVQTRGVPGTDPFTSHVLGPADIQTFSQINDGSTVDFAAQLGLTTPETVDLNVLFSSFASAFLGAAPGPSIPYSFDVLAISEVKAPQSSLSDPQMNEVSPIFADASIQGPTSPRDPDPWPKDANGNDTWPDDKDYGTLTYNNPFGTGEKAVYIVDVRATYSIPFPGSSDPLPWTVDMSYALTTLPSGPISAVMLPPANGNADGVAFLTGGTISSTTPTLSWDAPEGKPDGPTDVLTYDVYICEPQNSSGGKGGGGVACVTDLYVSNVPANSYIVPAGVLQAGHPYIFNITAVSVRDYDPINQQRFSYPVASSQVASAAITAGALQKGSVQSAARHTLRDQAALNSPLHRTIFASVPGGKHGSVVYSTPSWHHPVVSGQQPSIRKPR